MGYMDQPGAPPAAWQGPRLKEDQNSPRCLQPPMICSRSMRVDEAGPSRNLINTGCQPTKISAHAHEHGLKKSERLAGFPSENRYKPHQSSLSETPRDRMSPEPIETQPPTEIVNGLWSLERMKECWATRRVSGWPGADSVVSTTELEGSKASALVP